MNHKKLNLPSQHFYDTVSGFRLIEILMLLPTKLEMETINAFHSHETFQICERAKKRIQQNGIRKDHSQKIYMINHHLNGN